MSITTTVLLIDDDVDDQEFFCDALKQVKPTTSCVVANDGVNALDLIQSDINFNPDYIFIDMNMPRMNGEKTLEEIKKIKKFHTTPTYMYSTAAIPTNVEKTKCLGAIDFIIKSSNFQDLIKVLGNIIK